MTEVPGYILPTSASCHCYEHDTVTKPRKEGLSLLRENSGKYILSNFPQSDPRRRMNILGITIRFLDI